MKNKLALFFACCLAACGGGGGGAPSGAEALLSLSGVYGGGPLQTVIIDSDGRLAASLGAADPQQTIAVRSVLTGTVTASVSSWSSDNAMFAQTVSRAGFTPVQVTDVPASVSGTFAERFAVQFGIGANGISSLLPAQFTVPHREEAQYPTASLTVAAGRYTWDATGSDLVIANTGSVSGTLRTNCVATGQARVTNPGRNVYTFELALAGAGCSGAAGGPVVFLGYLAASPSPGALVLIGKVGSDPIYATLVRS